MVGCVISDIFTAGPGDFFTKQFEMQTRCKMSSRDDDESSDLKAGMRLERRDEAIVKDEFIKPAENKIYPHLASALSLFGSLRGAVK